MFHRKDAVPLLFLLLVILTIMITLSQILVVHNKHQHVQKESRDIHKFKAMLLQLERHINSMLKKDVLPLNKYRESFAAEIYVERINSLMKKEEMKIDNEMSVPNKMKKEHARTNRYWTTKRISRKTFPHRTLRSSSINSVNMHRNERISRINNYLTKKVSQNEWASTINNYVTNKVTKKQRISTINNYVTNNVTDSKFSRSLLLQQNGHDHESAFIGNSSAPSDVDGQLDGLPPSSASEQSAINEETPRRSGNNVMNLGTSLHGNDHVTMCPKYPTGLGKYHKSLFV